MARLGRQWSKVDKALMDYFAKVRSEFGEPSLRKLAEQSGVKHTRLGDLFKQINGVPTFDEFILLCETFSINPKTALETILDAAEGLEEEQRSHSSTPVINDDVPLTADGEVDYTELTRRFNPEELGMAAYRDPNKYVESQTPAE